MMMKSPDMPAMLAILPVRKARSAVVATLGGLLMLSACVHSNERALHDVGPLVSADTASSDSRRLIEQLRRSEESPYLKVHMTNGDVYVLDERDILSGEGVIEGRGVHLGARRDTLDAGNLTVPLDSVVLFETNRIELSGPSLALTVLTGVSAVLTAACLSNPKACFGSCPTFYVDDVNGPALRAEGFSSSIAPSLEAADVDALGLVRPDGGRVTVEMRNEALETHVVRRVDLLAVPRGSSEGVVRLPDDGFRVVRRHHAPSSCSAPEGDCLADLTALDRSERFSSADSTDLATFETIDLTFAPSAGVTMDSLRFGVVIAARQSLLTTYLLYQALAWMGTDAGRWLARIENSAGRLHGLGLGRILGGIDVQVRSEGGEWTSAGEILEHGPLATDIHTVTLPRDLPAGPVEVRLRLAKGAWRIDRISLAELGREVAALRLQPTRVTRTGSSSGTTAPDALSILRDPDRSLTTLPGDTWRITYELPGGEGSTAGYDLYLESEGYYLEWIREEWLAEESPEQLARMLFSPEDMLRELAPEYKKVESDMEDMFWRSRYAE